MSRFKLSDGGVKHAVFLDYSNGRVVIPTEEQTDRLLSLPHAESVGSECAQSFSVVFHFDSIDEFKAADWEIIHSRIAQALAG